LAKSIEISRIWNIEYVLSNTTLHNATQPHTTLHNTTQHYKQNYTTPHNKTAQRYTRPETQNSNKYIIYFFDGFHTFFACVLFLQNEDVEDKVLHELSNHEVRVDEYFLEKLVPTHAHDLQNLSKTSE